MSCQTQGTAYLQIIYTCRVFRYDIKNFTQIYLCLIFTNRIMFCLICPNISLLKKGSNVQILVIPPHFGMCSKVRFFPICSLNICYINIRKTEYSVPTYMFMVCFLPFKFTALISSPSLLLWLKLIPYSGS